MAQRSAMQVLLLALTTVQVETLYTAVQAAVSKPRKNLRITTVLPVTMNGCF